VSLIPFGLLDVRPLVSPATDVVFALPMPSVAIHCGPVAMFPPHVQVTHTARLFRFVHAPLSCSERVSKWRCTASLE